LLVVVTSSGRILRTAVDEKAPLAVQLVFQLFFGLCIRRVTCCNPFALPEIIISNVTFDIVITLTVIGIHISYPSSLRPTTTCMRWFNSRT